MAVDYNNHIDELETCLQNWRSVLAEDLDKVRRVGHCPRRLKQR